MGSVAVAAVIVFAVLLTAEAGGHGGQRGGWQGQQDEGMGRGGSQNGRMARGGWQGQDDEQRGPQGRFQGNNRGGSDSSKFRTNLYNDDDVYGYDAKYPNGEALYVNYRNTEARARRGPDFARSNSISARAGNRQGMQSSQYDSGNSRQQRGQQTDDQW